MVRYLNTTKIEWTDFTWNLWTGCEHWKDGICKVGKNCYALQLTKRFPNAFLYGFVPHFYPERASAPYSLKKPSKIFAINMGDPFGTWVKEAWIMLLLKIIKENPNHTFQLLTKDPNGMLEWTFPDNTWAGVTVNTRADLWRIDTLRKVKAKTKFVSFEPLYESLEPVNLSGIQWVIIGAQTSPKRFPENEWVEYLINTARNNNIAIFTKNNLEWREKIEEYP